MFRSLRALPALVLLLLCWGLAPARAQEAPPHVDETPPPKVQPPRAAPLKAGPAKAAPPRHTPGPAVKNDGKRYLRSLDENHDGRVSRQEFLARAKEKFAELDLNHDGALSPAELRKAREHERAKRDAARRRAGKPPAEPRAGAPGATLADRDLDGNGRVTLKEYLARREEKFAELDRNRDGVLSREEARAEKTRILARRAEIRAEKKAVAARQAQRQAARDEKQAARQRREARREELAAEREARVERRVERMAKKARAEWVLAPEAAALAPAPAAPAAP